MLTNNHKEQAQQLAKKHGKAVNPKSSFNTILKGKIIRTDRPVDDKENESSHVLGELPSKCARSLNQSKGLKKNSPTSTPLLNTSFNGKLYEVEEKSKKSSPKYCIAQDSINESNAQSSSFRLKPSNDYSELLPLSLKVAQSISTSERSSMTEECYYQKQLEIKVEILKKERDQLWDSITGIVKENQCLKDALAFYTMKEHQACAIQTDKAKTISEGFQTQKEQLTSSGFQTEAAELRYEETQTQNTCIHLQTECLKTDINQLTEIGLQTDISNQITTSFQTDLTSTQMDQFAIRYQKSLAQKRQVLQFCETLYLQDISAQLSDCLNMKDAISQYLSMKLDNLIKQFESQKAMLHRIYEEYINQFKKNEEQLQEKNQGLISTIQDNKIINKKLQENIQLCQQKISILQESNYILNNELMQAQQGLTQSKKQAELIKECLETEKIRWEMQKSLWNEKRAIYSNLLVESHRTINSLMAQMKEFQEMASSNHFRHLRPQKHHQNECTRTDI